MNTPMDPMSQYDPATEAMITGKMSPQHKVAQAMMAQQGSTGAGSGILSLLKGLPGVGGIGGPLFNMLFRAGIGPKIGLGNMMNGAPSYDPVMGTGTPPMSPVPVSPMDQASSLSSLRR